jgi:hypothetical protein
MEMNHEQFPPELLQFDADMEKWMVSAVLIGWAGALTLFPLQ